MSASATDPARARILVSACLLGQPVRYDGRARTLAHDLLARWQAEGRVVPLCPEVAAGFPTPRPPAEIAPGHEAAGVLEGRAPLCDPEGHDLSEGFRAAARIALETARRHDCRFALLTDGSPSCGTTFVHSGRHDGGTRPGMGVVARLLADHGITAYPPQRIEALAAALHG